MLPREGEKLTSQSRGAVRIRFDLLDIIIVDVSRRVPHQHQVAVADDRRQDVVEVVRDAAGELADDLHFRRLRNLPLELGFLAIVLEKEQHRRIAKTAQPGNRQCDGFRRLVTSTELQGRPTSPGPARFADGVGNCGFIFLDDKVARDNWEPTSRLIPAA